MWLRRIKPSIHNLLSITWPCAAPISSSPPCLFSETINKWLRLLAQRQANNNNNEIDQNVYKPPKENGWDEKCQFLRDSLGCCLSALALAEHARTCWIPAIQVQGGGASAWQHWYPTLPHQRLTNKQSDNHAYHGRHSLSETEHWLLVKPLSVQEAYSIPKFIISTVDAS